MAITVRSFSTGGDDGSATPGTYSVARPSPAPQNGDAVLLLLWSDETGDLWTVPVQSWELEAQAEQTYTHAKGRVYTRASTGAEPTSYTFQAETGAWMASAVLIAALEGVPEGAPIFVEWADGENDPPENGGPMVAPAVEYTGSDPLVIRSYTYVKAYASGASIDLPAGLTAFGAAIDSDWMIARSGYQVLTGTPTIGTATATAGPGDYDNGSDGQWRAVTIVIPGTLDDEEPLPDPEPVEDLVDDFDDGEIDAELWPNVFGVTAEEDGHLTAVALASGVASGVESVAKYTLAGSQISVQMTPPSAEDSDWAVAAVSLWDAPGGYGTFIRVWRDSVLVEGAQGIGIYAAVGGIEAISGVYDVEVPGSADWVRLREDDGTLYLDVSANGITWSVLDSWETPAGIAGLTHMSVILEAYRAEASADGDPAQFDYLNVTSPYVIATGTGEAALALGLAGQGGRVATGTGVATLTAAADSAAGAIARTGGGAAVLAASATGTGPTARTGGSAAALEISPVGGGVRTRTGTGAATLAPGASGTGLATRTGIGAAALAPDAAGSGAAERTGAAAVALAPDAAGAGARHTAGAGAAELAADASGTGEETRWHTGAAALDLAATGGGERHAAGTGDAALDLAATGAGERHATGTGAVTLALTTASSGEKGIRGGSRLILGSGGGGDKAAAGASDKPLAVASAVTGAKLAAGQGAAPLTIGVDGVGNVIYIAHRALTIDVGGDGSKDTAGQGGAGLSITSTGDGVKVTTGAGGVTLRLRPSPQGAADASGTGEATLAAAAGGAGTRHAVGTGAARLSPATAGAGDRHAPGTGRVLLSPVGGGVGTRHAPGAGHAVLAPAAGGAGTRHTAGTGDVALAVFPGAGAVRRVTGTGRARLRARARFGRRVPGRLVARHHGEIYDARF